MAKDLTPRQRRTLVSACDMALRWNHSLLDSLVGSGSTHDAFRKDLKATDRRIERVRSRLGGEVLHDTTADHLTDAVQSVVLVMHVLMLGYPGSELKQGANKAFGLASLLLPGCFVCGLRDRELRTRKFEVMFHWVTEPICQECHEMGTDEEKEGPW